MPLASHERSRSMGPLQGFRRGPVVPTTSPQGAFRNSLRKLKLFSFTPASPSSRKTRCAIFAGALKLSHKTRYAIFAGALKMSAMVGALFFVRKGREPTAAERAGINEKLLSAVGSRGRRVRGMPACRSIPKPRRTRASARSRVKPDI